MEFTFPAIMEVIVTPITVLIGIIGNILCIVVLNKKEVQLRKSFSRILIALSIFDITFISSTAVLFSMRTVSQYYHDHIYPWTVPIFLPIAQISLTASVYTTVVTCFDRYIAICRPALGGCCGRSEDTTSWGLIIGTIFFSIVYNFSRFFEFNVKWITDEFQYNNKTGEEFYGELPPDQNPEDFVAFNKSFWFVEYSDLRQDYRYVQYYILVTNFIFMGIIPSIIMIIFNVLVVRAVNEANKKRARMTRRQQRNITVTSMLVTVVVVFLVCHFGKMLVNGYECYQLVKKNMASIPDPEVEVPFRLTNEHSNHSIGASDNITTISDVENTEDEAERNGFPIWVENMTIVSHWLLILNSSCNIVIYLHKDPKFKAVLKDMFVSKLSPRVRNAFRISESNLDEEEPMTTAKFITRGNETIVGGGGENATNGHRSLTRPPQQPPSEKEDHKIQNNGQTTSSNTQLVPLKSSLETTKISISLESNQITLQKCPLIVEQDLTGEVAI